MEDFFVLNFNVFDYLRNNKEIFEHRPLEKLAKHRQLIAYKHEVAGNAWIRQGIKNN